MDHSSFKKVIKINTSGKPKQKLKRQLKNKSQNRLLMQMYKQNKNWTKSKIRMIS